MEGFEVDFQEILPGLAGRSLQAHDSVSGLVFSVHIDPAPDDGDATDFRDGWWDNLKNSNDGERKDVELYERNDVAYFEYVYNLPDGAMSGLDQKHVFACMVRDDLWIGIHLSKGEFKAEDQVLFDDFLETTRIVENYSPTGIDLFVFGSQYYRIGDYGGAAPYYQQALDREKQTRSLSEPLWLVLIDNLGMCYGIKGKLDDAQAVFEYGVSVRPDYPMFYYNLACTNAERNDLDQTLHYLALAHGNKENMIDGEDFPDPMKDPSFKPYRQDERFLSLVEGFAIPSSAVVMNLTLPGLSWAVQVLLDDFEVEFQNIYEDFDGRTLQASNGVRGLQLAVFIEKARKGGDATKFRERTFKDLKQTQFTIQDVREFERDSIAYLIYTEHFGEGVPLPDMKRAYAFMVKDKKWVTVRLYRDAGMPHTDSIIQNFFDNVRILDDYTPASMEYFTFGRLYFQRKKYEEAARQYQMALDQEIRGRSLPETHLLVLIDQLGMCYGIKGKLDEAQAIFEYGISERPDFPMFYYNLACTYANRKDLDQTLHYLTLAHDRIGNLIEGEVFPDPMEDSDFKRYRKDERFLALINSWQD